MAPDELPLTQLARAAGCAAKIGQADLKAALSRLPVANDPQILVSHITSDDAAVVRLGDEIALVETVDVFPPIVDDPYDYGRIAATNALSDIYAMGAAPLNALSFVAWPVDRLGLAPLARVFEGAAAVCAKAGITISGGHSIVDEEPKFGLFVTGTVRPDALVTNAGARPGDILVLTKKIGTGILTTAAKRGRLSRDGLAEAVESMATLNRAAAEAMSAADVRAATDITGFGLLGHLGNLLRASSAAMGQMLGARIGYSCIPLFDGVEALLEDGLCPGGTRRNLDHAAPNTHFADGLDEPQQLLLADAQTSGGLLMAVTEATLDALLNDLGERGVPVSAVIGNIEIADSPGRVTVV
ncbi:MAG: selenide, water dikinase SelD [Alphaproteobacteria bacterium]|nr:selenide, water dikinase SelD [Alphaproteobacteria bacterium]